MRPISNRIIKIRDSKDNLERIQKYIYDDTKTFVMNHLPLFAEALSVLKEVEANDYFTKNIGLDIESYLQDTGLSYCKATNNDGDDDDGKHWCFVVYNQIAITDDGKVVKLNQNKSMYDDVGIATIHNYSEETLIEFRQNINHLCSFITDLFAAVDKLINDIDARVKDAEHNKFSVMLLDVDDSEDEIDLSQISSDTAKSEELLESGSFWKATPETSDDDNVSEALDDDNAPATDDDNITEPSEDDDASEVPEDYESESEPETEDDNVPDNVPEITEDDNVSEPDFDDEGSEDEIPEDVQENAAAESDDSVGLYEDEFTREDLIDDTEIEIATQPEMENEEQNETPVDRCIVTVLSETDKEAVLEIATKYTRPASKFSHSYFEINLPYVDDNGNKQSFIVSSYNHHHVEYDEEARFVHVTLEAKNMYKIGWQTEDGAWTQAFKSATLNEVLDVYKTYFAE